MIFKNWMYRLTILVVIALPAFSGYPLYSWQMEMLPGVTWTVAGYLLGVHIGLCLLLGPALYPIVCGISALISLPVVFSGAAVAAGLHALRIDIFSQPHAAHYVNLLITMMTVVPLALGLMALIPFQQFEHALLSRQRPVRKIEKAALMFLRVFNHTVYAILPNMLEVMREEWQPIAERRRQPLLQRVAQLLRLMIQLSAECICAAIQYIPLWTVEIAQLPDTGKTAADTQHQIMEKK